MSNEEIFFSYSRDDGEFVLRLGEDLRAQGIDLWLDQLDIAAGERWDRAIEAAMERALTVCVVLSVDSVASPNVMDEVSFALEEGKRVIPILLEECDVPFRIRRLQYVDFSGSYDKGLSRLIRELRAPTPQPPPKPSPEAGPEPPPPEQRQERRREGIGGEEPEPDPPSRGKALWWVAGAAVLLVAAFLVFQMASSGKRGGEGEIEGIRLPAWVIADSAFAQKRQAQARLVELNRKGLSKTGFFWIPEFRYLSGKELFQVYVGPFPSRQDAMRALCNYDRRMDTETYAVRLSSKPGREQITCKGQ